MRKSPGVRLSRQGGEKAPVQRRRQRSSSRCLRATLAAADGACENDGRRLRHLAEIGHSPGLGPDGRIGKIIAVGVDPAPAGASGVCVNWASCRQKSRFAAEQPVLKPHTPHLRRREHLLGQCPLDQDDLTVAICRKHAPTVSCSFGRRDLRGKPAEPPGADEIADRRFCPSGCGSGSRAPGSSRGCAA